ncbi:MAG: CPBP family intramembrane metalloprotease [Clostridia bacterium]|nr:CPBP family intramembrane metalloprotease [Clostridia bacterium]
MENNYNPQNFVPQNGTIQHQNIRFFPAEYFEKKAEKKILKRRANWLGSELLFTQVFGTIASVFALILLSFMGWGNGEGGVMEDALEYIFYSPVALLIPAVIIAKACGLKVVDLIPFKKVSFSSGLGLFLFGFFFLVIGGMLVDIVSFILPSSAAFLELAQSADPTNYGEWVSLILYSAAIPALVEEFVFRGVILNSLRRYGDAIAICFSTMMFALVHGNILQIVNTIPAGLFLGYITVCSGNIWIAVALHFVNNTIACFSGIIYNTLSSFITGVVGNISEDLMVFIINGIVYAVYIILGLVGLFILKNKQKKDEDFGALQKGTVTCLTNSEKIKGLFSAPTVIISIIIYVGQTILLLLPPVIEFLKL